MTWVRIRLAHTTASRRRCWNSWALVAVLAGICPMVSVAQTQRPPIIPIGQGSGSATIPQTTLPNTIAGISDEPISAGEVVHISVFNAPDFSLATRVSESGDIAMPFLGAVHISGLSSMAAGRLIASQLKSSNLLLDPEVILTVEGSTTGITVLGEVHSPGIFPFPGKHQLSDVLAAAGGLTANTGRVIEISNNRNPEAKEYVPWDPTMHNTSSYDRMVSPGDRILVRACGIAYIGGNVARPGAYSLCGSPKMTLSEVITLAGGITPLSAANRTVLIRPRLDGSKMIVEIQAQKVLVAKAPDMTVQEDDIIYVPSSGVKTVTTRALAFSMTLAAPLLYVYR